MILNEFNCKDIGGKIKYQMCNCLLNDRSFQVYVIWVLSLFLGMPFCWRFFLGCFSNSYCSKVGERIYLKLCKTFYEIPCVESFLRKSLYSVKFLPSPNFTSNIKQIQENSLTPFLPEIIRKPTVFW